MLSVYHGGCPKLNHLWIRYKAWHKHVYTKNVKTHEYANRNLNCEDMYMSIQSMFMLPEQLEEQYILGLIHEKHI